MKGFTLFFLASFLHILSAAMYSSDQLINQAFYMIYDLGETSEVPDYLMSAANNNDVSTFRFILGMAPDYAEQCSSSIAALETNGKKYLQVLDAAISSNCAGCLEALFEGREVTGDLVQRCVDMNIFGHAAVAAYLQPMWLANLVDYEPIRPVAQVIPPPAAPKGPKPTFIMDVQGKQSQPYRGQYFHGGRPQGVMHVYEVDANITVMCMEQGVEYIPHSDFDRMDLKNGPEALAQYLYAKPSPKSGVIFWYNQATGEAQTHILDSVKKGPVLAIFDGQSCLPELVQLQRGVTVKSAIKTGFNIVFYDAALWDVRNSTNYMLFSVASYWDAENPFETVFGEASRDIGAPEIVFGVKFE